MAEARDRLDPFGRKGSQGLDRPTLGLLEPRPLARATREKTPRIEPLQRGV